MEQKLFIKVGVGKRILTQNDVLQYKHQKIDVLCIAKDVKIINKKTFYQFFHIKKVIFEAGSLCEEIQKEAFSYCISLKEVLFPFSIKKIDSQAFAFCFQLGAVCLPRSIEIIANESFYYCYSIKHITILNSEISFLVSAFKGCQAIKEVHIGQQVYYTKFANAELVVYQKTHKFQNYTFCRGTLVECMQKGVFHGEKMYFLWSGVGRYLGYGKNLHEALQEYRFLCGRAKLRKEIGDLTPDTEITLDQYRALTYDCKAGAEGFLAEHNIPLDSKMKISAIYELSQGYGHSYILGHIMAKEDRQQSFSQWLGLEHEVTIQDIQRFLLDG